MLHIAISVLHILLHQHVEQVWCFSHPVVRSTSVVGTTIGVLKIDQFKVLVIPFFPLALYLMKRYLCHNRLLRLIVKSFNQLYSFGLRTWLFLWLNHLMNKLLRYSNSNCLSRPLVTTLDINPKIINSCFFWSTSCQNKN